MIGLSVSCRNCWEDCSDVYKRQQEQNGGIYARVQSITIDGQPIDLNKTYTVATIDYLTGGGDGYSFSHPIIGEYGTMSDAVIEYMNTVSEQQMHAFSRSRLTILEDSLSETVLLAKANVQVPDALYTHLTKPDVLPQSVVRAMQGQRRSLIFDVDTQGETIRWAWDCAALENPMDVDLTVELSDTTNNPALQALTKDCAPLFIGLNAQQLPGETALRIPWTSDAPYFYRIDGDSAIQVGAVEAVDGWATLLLARGGEYLLTKTAISGGASPQPTQSLAPSASPQNGGDVPKTGDDQDAALPIACMAGAMALAAAGVLVYRKRLSHRGNGA